jgi:hypothetical protein
MLLEEGCFSHGHFLWDFVLIGQALSHSHSCCTTQRLLPFDEGPRLKGAESVGALFKEYSRNGPDKRAAVQEIEDMIMLFAAANGGRT